MSGCCVKWGLQGRVVGGTLQGWKGGCFSKMERGLQYRGLDSSEVWRTWLQPGKSDRWEVVAKRRFSLKRRVRDSPESRAEDLYFLWKWGKGIRWESGLSIPTEAGGEKAHSRVVKCWKAEGPWASHEQLAWRDERQQAGLCKEYTKHIMTKKKISIWHLLHHMITASVINSLPLSPECTLLYMLCDEQWNPLSISPSKWEWCLPFLVQGAGGTLQEEEAVLQFPPRVEVGGVGVRSSSSTLAPAVGPECSTSSALQPYQEIIFLQLSRPANQSSTQPTHSKGLLPISAPGLPLQAHTPATDLLPSCLHCTTLPISCQQLPLQV